MPETELTRWDSSGRKCRAIKKEEIPGLSSEKKYRGKYKLVLEARHREYVVIAVSFARLPAIMLMCGSAARVSHRYEHCCNLRHQDFPPDAQMTIRGVPRSSSASANSRSCWSGKKNLIQFLKRTFLIFKLNFCRNTEFIRTGSFCLERNFQIFNLSSLLSIYSTHFCQGKSCLRVVERTPCM